MESNLKKQKYVFTELHKQHLREAHLGKPGGMLGKQHSEECKQRMAKAHTGKKHSEETKAKMAAKRAEYWKKMKGVKDE